MKPLFFLTCTYLLWSCAPGKNLFGGHQYTYKYSLSAPTPDTSLKFSDKTIDAVFIITDKEINFTIFNKTDNPLKIVWDEASIVLLGKSNNVTHKGIKYIEKGAPMSPNTISPHSRWDDLVIPTDNITYHEGGGYLHIPSSWDTKELFPIRDMNKPEFKNAITGMKGQEVVLYLPIRGMNNENLGYSFTFKIDDVVMK